MVCDIRMCAPYRCLLCQGVGLNGGQRYQPRTGQAVCLECPVGGAVNAARTTCSVSIYTSVSSAGVRLDCMKALWHAHPALKSILVDRAHQCGAVVQLFVQSRTPCCDWCRPRTAGPSACQFAAVITAKSFRNTPPPAQVGNFLVWYGTM